MIKFTEQLITENKSTSDHKHEFGCVMLDLYIPNWNDIITTIKKSDLYQPDSDSSFGCEKSSHITVIYGLHPEVTDDEIEKTILEFKDKLSDSSILKIEGLGKFEGKEYDVLKFNIKCDILNEFNGKLKKFPYTSKYNGYIPHMTIAYLKPGKIDEYLNSKLEIKDMETTGIDYSMTTGKRIIWDI